jgi:hypothetical protein
MKIRELVGLVVDADVEGGPQTLVVAQDKSGKIYSIIDVELDDSDEDAPPTVWLRIDET